MYRVLIVEDDEQILSGLKIFLQLQDCQVVGAGTVADGLTQIAQKRFDLLLFDINLPDGNGIDLCRKVREKISDVPILFMSANSEEEIVIQGLGAGADDYIRKPFGNKELWARMSRAIERSPDRIERVIVGPMTIDLKERRVFIKDKELILTRCEFDILKALSRRPGNILSREQILDVLGDYKDLNDRTVDSHISHLRAKLKKMPEHGVRIAASYGLGYRIDWSAQ